MSQKAYAFTTATLFTLIGLLHALRLTFRWIAVLEGREVPMWASWIGFVIALFLAYEGFRLARKG